MEDAFKNPPATLHDTFMAVLDRIGIPLQEMTEVQVVLCREVVSYVYLCGVGRMVALLPGGDLYKSCNDEACALQIKAEALQVLVEVAQANDPDQRAQH